MNCRAAFDNDFARFVVLAKLTPSSVELHTPLPRAVLCVNCYTPNVLSHSADRFVCLIGWSVTERRSHPADRTVQPQRDGVDTGGWLLQP